jgi:hypothetical protein
MTDSV